MNIFFFWSKNWSHNRAAHFSQCAADQCIGLSRSHVFSLIHKQKFWEKNAVVDIKKKLSIFYKYYINTMILSQNMQPHSHCNHKNGLLWDSWGVGVGVLVLWDWGNISKKKKEFSLCQNNKDKVSEKAMQMSWYGNLRILSLLSFLPRIFSCLPPLLHFHPPLDSCGPPVTSPLRNIHKSFLVSYQSAFAVLASGSK